MTRQARKKASIASRGRSGVDANEARNDKPANTKQNAVMGDMWPIGAPPAAPSMENPKCSAGSCTSKHDKTNRMSAAKVPDKSSAAPRRRIPCAATRARSIIAAPNTMNSAAVLGAIGIKSIEKLGHLNAQPASAQTPNPAANAPPIKAVRNTRLFSPASCAITPLPHAGFHGSFPVA